MLHSGTSIGRHVSRLLYRLLYATISIRSLFEESSGFCVACEIYWNSWKGYVATSWHVTSNISWSSEINVASYAFSLIFELKIITLTYAYADSKNDPVRTKCPCWTANLGRTLVVKWSYSNCTGFLAPWMVLIQLILSNKSSVRGAIHIQSDPWERGIKKVNAAEIGLTFLRITDKLLLPLGFLQQSRTSLLSNLSYGIKWPSSH